MRPREPFRLKPVRCAEASNSHALPRELVEAQPEYWAFLRHHLPEPDFQHPLCRMLCNSCKVKLRGRADQSRSRALAGQHLWLPPLKAPLVIACWRRSFLRTSACLRRSLNPLPCLFAPASSSPTLPSSTSTSWNRGSPPTSRSCLTV